MTIATYRNNVNVDSFDKGKWYGNSKNLSESHPNSGKNLHLYYTIKSSFFDKSIIEREATFDNNSNDSVYLHRFVNQWN